MWPSTPFCPASSVPGAMIVPGNPVDHCDSLCIYIKSQSHVFSSVRKLRAGFCSIHVFLDFFGWICYKCSVYIRNWGSHTVRCFAMLCFGWGQTFCVNCISEKNKSKIRYTHLSRIVKAELIICVLLSSNNKRIEK